MRKMSGRVHNFQIMDEAGIRVDASAQVIEKDNNEVIITHLWVRRELRGHGLGYQLLSWIVSIYQDKIIKAVVFPYAEKFYEKFGFKREGQIGSYSVYVKYPKEDKI
ncbi:acetyltransferase [uncultured archaeal virus]|uniref:Acetyltransferase n=1 Tax=uncultured archaeal virus TaxID=1960247 RepID=A0A1S5Y374_9VIRU|nr:acetyltransferase [uncultured archaeal virus]